MSEYNISAIEYTNGQQPQVTETVSSGLRSVHVLVTPDRIDKIPMKYWEEVEKGTISGMIEMSAWFLANSSAVYYSHEEGKEIIRKMPRGQALEMVQTISKHIQEVAAPKP